MCNAMSDEDRTALAEVERSEIRPENFELLSRVLVDVKKEKAVPTYVAEALPRTEAKGDKPCSICLEPIPVGSVIYKLECSCENHEQCLADWFEKGEGKNCPSCWKEVNTV